MADEKKNMNEEIDAQKTWRQAIWISVAIWLGGAALTWLIAVFFIWLKNGELSEIAGLLGDSFGSVNALVSALAFAGVIVTFYLQRHELKLQHQELRAQREEFEQQNKTMKLQRFENTFFNMMQLQQQIVNDLHLQISYNTFVHVKNGGGMETVTKELHGREVIRCIYDDMRTKVANYGFKAYSDVNNRDLLDHYFRHLYTIMRFVDESDAYVPDKDEDGNPVFDPQEEWKIKYRYTTILRATLSRYEMLILYYNGLSVFGREKLKPLIEKYALLDNIDKYHLVPSKECKETLYLDASINQQHFHDYGLTGKDYEFYLTEEENNPEKYNIKAFGCSKDAMNKAKQDIVTLQRALEEIKQKKNNRSSEQSTKSLLSTPSDGATVYATTSHATANE